MPLSGTVPFFDLSPTRGSSEVASIVVVTGVVADGQADGTNSNETFQEFLIRGIAALSLSGVLGVSGVSSGLQCVSGAVLSGVMQFQREMAFRLADIENLAAGNPARLAAAQAALVTGGGEVQFGE